MSERTDMDMKELIDDEGDETVSNDRDEAARLYLGLLQADIKPTFDNMTLLQIDVEADAKGEPQMARIRIGYEHVVPLEMLQAIMDKSEVAPTIGR